MKKKNRADHSWVMSWICKLRVAYKTWVDLLNIWVDSLIIWVGIENSWVAF